MLMTLDELKKKAINEYGMKKFVKQLEGKKEMNSKAKRDTEIGLGQVIAFLLCPILIRGDITIIYGGKGLGKTALTLFLAYLIALGKSFGFLNSIAKNIILYIDAEVGEIGLSARIRTVRNIFGLKQNENSSVHCQSKKYNLYTQEGRQELDKEIARVDPDVLVLDNLTSMNGGCVSPKGWDDFFLWAQNYQKQEISIIILYHANDDNSMRGSKMKLINAENPIFLERIDDDDTGEINKDIEEEDLDVIAVNDGNNIDNKRINKKVKSKLAKLPQDRRKLKVRMIFENLRNNPFPEAYTPIEWEYSITENKWSITNKKEYMIEVLSKLSHYCDDERIGMFFGKDARHAKYLREKYGIKKYNIDENNNGGQYVE